VRWLALLIVLVLDDVSHIKVLEDEYEDEDEDEDEPKDELNQHPTAFL
jgi:hypothetical protein